MKGPYGHNPHSRSGDPVPRQVVYPNEEMLGCDDYGRAPPPPPPMDRRDDYSGSSTIYTTSMYSPAQQCERQGPPAFPYNDRLSLDIPNAPPMPRTVRPPLHSQQTNWAVQVERERQQSAARHQILQEIAQAANMRRSASNDGDKRFWERQVDTLNESLRKL